MTTLTVYFAHSPSSNVHLFPMSSAINQTNPSTTLSLPDSPSSTPIRQKSSKRTKTFFERFNHNAPIPTITRSPVQQEENDLSSESTIHLRRHFTFRRSLRRSRRQPECDVDDGIRLGSLVRSPSNSSAMIDEYVFTLIIEKYRGNPYRSFITVVRIC